MKVYFLIVILSSFHIKIYGQTTVHAMLSEYGRKTPLMGINGNAMYNNTWINSALTDSIKNLNPSIIRYPGGTPGNFWDWKSGWPKAPYTNYNPPSNVLTVRHNELKIGLDSCRAQMLYTVNMYNSNLDYQMQGINYASSLKIPIKFIELGNEHNLTLQPIAANTYSNLSKKWCDTIKTYYPNAKVCLVGGDLPSNPNWINGIISQNINFDALSFHVYPLPASSVLNTKSAFSQAYSVTGQRFSNSHFANIPNKEVWVTEYNMSSGNTGMANTWSQVLFVLSMMDTLIQSRQITMLIPWAYSGPNSYLQALNYDNFSMQATGVAVKLIDDVTRGLDSCRKIIFSNTQYQLFGATYFPKIFGYKFFDLSGNANAFFVNLSSTNYTIDFSSISLSQNSSFKQFSADTIQIITNGFQNLNISSGFSNGVISMHPYSVLIIHLQTPITEVSENSSSEVLNLLPNPFSEMAVLQTNDVLDGTTLTIYNLYGQKVKEYTDLSGHSYQLYRDNLKAGFYMIQLKRVDKLIASRKIFITN